MSRSKTNGNLALAGFDEIFNSSATPMNCESVVEIAITELHPPEFHPFLINDDQGMMRLAKSVQQYGVREPGIARPLEGGGYELICGNRRKRACELAGIPTMPIIIRCLDDDDSTITMVDSNLEQRDKLLYSEKAWAYRLKLEALNHRGSKSDTPGQLSVEILCEQTGESKNQVFRLVRLTELIVALLDKVDSRKLAFNPAVELSYLSQMEQTMVASAMDKYEAKPTLSQAQRLKKMKKAEGLTADAIDAVFAESKRPSKNEPENFGLFRKYFPPDCTQRQIEAVIIELLTDWKRKKESA